MSTHYDERERKHKSHKTLILAHLLITALAFELRQWLAH